MVLTLVRSESSDLDQITKKNQIHNTVDIVVKLRGSKSFHNGFLSCHRMKERTFELATLARPLLAWIFGAPAGTYYVSSQKDTLMQLIND
jgi:hypothetical protein